MQETLVDLRGVTKRYGAQTIVDSVSLEIGRGEFFSILGSSGCGKSTTLRMIAGFETPDEGEILIGGDPGREVPAYVRHVNMVFQNYALFPHMTVEENIGFGPRMAKTSKAETARVVAEMLELTRLTPYARRLPSQLSGGQQQRVALARALATRPAVVLLDEPLGALDLKLRKEMQHELKRIQEERGLTFVYVTHDQEEALTMSDRICVMHEGRAAQVGTPEEIYERPRTRFVAGFIGESNFLSGRVASRVNGHISVEVAGQMVAAMTPAGGCEEGQEVVLAIRPEKIRFTADGAETPDGTGMSGRVQRTVFLGGDRLFHVELSNGAMVRVRGQTDAAPNLDRGAPVRLALPASAVSVVREN